MFLPRFIDFPTISPTDHPARSLYAIFFAAYFTVVSLRLFQNLKTGVTLVSRRKYLYFPVRILPGRVALSASQKKLGFIYSYNKTFSTAVLGFLCYLGAQVLIVLMFKGVDYTF